MSTLRPNLSDAGKDGFPTAMAWGAGSKRLAVGTRGGSLQVYDMITKVTVSDRHQKFQNKGSQ